ncbi:MAG: transposase [Desulfurivibrionaceae bacterium]|nr:transposase [Desulfurivibrionaceae bacterium]
MGKIPHGRYTKEFREEAARMVLEGGLSAVKAARELGQKIAEALGAK